MKYVDLDEWNATSQSHPDFEIEDCVTDETYEFDAPRFSDFVMLRQLVERFGEHKALEEEARIAEQVSEKWFRKLHLEHEHEEANEPRNLLTECQFDDETFQFMTDHAKSVADELNSSSDERDEIARKFGSVSISTKPAKTFTMRTGRRGGVETSHITRRVDRENEFVRENDSTPSNFTTVNAIISMIPELKTLKVAALFQILICAGIYKSSQKGRCGRVLETV